MKVTAPLARALPSGIQPVPQVGETVSILLTEALVQVLLFPTLSVMVTSQVRPFPVRAQEPPAVAIQLSRSVLQVKVAITFPLVGAVVL